MTTLGQACGVQEQEGSTLTKNGRPVKVEKKVIEAMKQTTFVEGAVVTLAIVALQERLPLTLGRVQVMPGQEFDVELAVQEAVAQIGQGQRMSGPQKYLAVKAVKLAWVEFANRLPIAEGFESRVEAFFRLRNEEEKFLKRKGLFGHRLKNQLKSKTKQLRHDLGEVNGQTVTMLMTLPDAQYKLLKETVETAYESYLKDLIERNKPKVKRLPGLCERHKRAILEKGDHIVPKAPRCRKERKIKSRESAQKRLVKLLVAKSRGDAELHSVYQTLNAAFSQ